MAAFAYCADIRLRKPLTISCANLLLSADYRHQVDVYAILDGWKPRQVDSLRRAMDLTGTPYSLNTIGWEPRRYASFRPFQGSLTCYAVLELFDRAPVERLVYLDADTVPTVEAINLAQYSLQNFVIGAVYWDETARDAHEAALYSQCGLAEETPVFNSGVMLVDACAWQKNRLTDAALEIGKRVGPLVTGDQTVLNLLFRGNFLALPWRYNVRLHSKAKRYMGDGIAHFVGRPKPWTLAGLLTHKNFAVWYRAARLASKSPLGPLR